MYHSNRQLLKRLAVEYVRPYKHILFLAIFCMIVVAVTTATNAWLLQPALDQIFIERNERMLWMIPLAVFGVALIGAAANYGNVLFMRYLGQRLVADMQVRLFDHLMKSDIGLFHSESSGRLISRFTNDISLMRNAFSNVLTAIAKESLCMIFLVGVMIYQNALLALIALVVFPIAFYPIIMLGKKMRRYSDKTQVQLGDFTASLDEVFQGVRTVKAYSRETYESARAKNMIEGLFRLYYKATRVVAAATPMMEVLSGLSIALVIWYGGYQVFHDELTPGAFFSFIAAFLMAYKPVRSLAGLNTTLQEGLAAANRLFTVMDITPDIKDAPDAKPLAFTQGNIVFSNVSFAYAEGGRGVSDITIDIPAGKKVALVGHSGGGKSTLMNVLLRFYDVQQGSITIDGQDTKQVTLASLRGTMAYVPQESMLFDDSVFANIAYGREGASRDEVIEAAKAAAAHDFIMQLPEGYSTMIGSHGVRLSGGQRQRLCIARAMLKNAPILLLDEATSALDNESERAIQQALNILMQGRTTLVIAHRLSTIVNADIIYVIEAGRVVEKGTHTSLLANKSAYYKLYAELAHDEKTA